VRSNNSDFVDSVVVETSMTANDTLNEKLPTAASLPVGEKAPPPHLKIVFFIIEKEEMRLL
jgi:hypothetical protein